MQKWENCSSQFFFNCQVPNRAEAEISESSQRVRDPSVAGGRQRRYEQ